ncbi:MAG: UDP-N-acetylglucosamine 2-epimerase (non-hydrolyzing) [Euryarchaeota archaeon]|nr:UDP-N-acetylglucosamine 2-epimerase (non-hydrolyzing) [Euryarchaeota archaeon]
MSDAGPIILVVGARPNFMKIAPIHFALKQCGESQVLLHTGQHYDENMSKVFFDDLGLPEPDIYLGVGSSSHSIQTAEIMVEFEKICQELQPRLVVVVGDVNSTLACTLVASKMQITTAHVEAGLRSGDMRMPEEVNRKVTDALSDILFTTSEMANNNLISEGRKEEDIFFVGNVMIDSLKNNLSRVEESKIFGKLKVERGSYGVLTLHRPSNVDESGVFKGIISSLEKICEHVKIVFPMHPRTKKRAIEFGLIQQLEENPRMIVTEPLGYLDFIALTSNSALVLTDSGGLQEETTALGIPCITIRENTERPITVKIGTNKLVGCDPEKIFSAAIESLNSGNMDHKIPEKWDGKTAQRIAEVLSSRGV